MFYCEACRVENGWTKGIRGHPSSVGGCEVCGQHDACYDVPSNAVNADQMLSPDNDTQNKTVKCSSCQGNGRVADPDHGHGQQCEPCKGSGVLIIVPAGDQKCPSCNGEGIFEDPQHGHSMKCEPCRGTGRVPRAVCEVHGCQRSVLRRRKICENHAFPAGRPPGTTGRRAAVLATRKKLAEEAKVSENRADESDEETNP